MQPKREDKRLTLVREAEARILARLPELAEALVQAGLRGDRQALVYLLNRMMGPPRPPKRALDEWWEQLWADLDMEKVDRWKKDEFLKWAEMLGDNGWRWMRMSQYFGLTFMGMYGSGEWDATEMETWLDELARQAQAADKMDPSSDDSLEEEVNDDDDPLG